MAMRTSEQIREHYQIEKELAAKLRNTSRQERLGLYSMIYDELFRRVPHHPMVTRKVDPESRKREAMLQVDMLTRFLKPEHTLLQIGPGDCEMAFQLSNLIKTVYAVDVSEEITHSETAPENFKLFLSDGTSVPVPPESVDVAYSNQLMEHLHPDDALEQVRNIFKTLKPGGIYICLTPNRIIGPHDVSKDFDSVATGLHLKEYTTAELMAIFKQVGFRTITALYDATGKLPPLPIQPVIVMERLCRQLPAGMGRRLSRNTRVATLLGVRLVARK
jgi:SAM-dependent methyltransferase